MLYVILASKNAQNKNNQVSFHVGDELIKFINEEIIEVQADCDELDSILDRMYDQIPRAFSKDGKLKRVHRWFGDHAKFIYHNLQW